jgi:hypothetical protein
MLLMSARTEGNLESRCAAFFVRRSAPPRPPRSNRPAFYERFEVGETFFETLAIHTLNNERIGELA